MLIKRLLEDPKGVEVKFPDGTIYKFDPSSQHGPYVAVVEHQAHIDRFLSIPEGYAAVTGQEPTMEPPSGTVLDLAAAIAAAATPAAQDTPASDDASLGAQQDGVSETAQGDDENGAPDGDNADQTQETNADQQHGGEVSTTSDGFEHMTDEALREAYQAEVGTPAHPRAGRALLIERITEARNSGEE